MQAVASVDKKAIRELKSFSSPPQAVLDVFALVNIQLGAVKYKKNGKFVDPTWSDSLKLMKDPSYLLK